MKKNIVILRIIHGLFALFFITCILYIYFAAITGHFTFYVVVAIGSLVLEGVMVFLLNKGDCPLIHVQRRIGDETPFFELFLSKKTAKKAVPFFLVVTIVGLLFLTIRFLLR